MPNYAEDSTQPTRPRLILDFYVRLRGRIRAALAQVESSRHCRGAKASVQVGSSSELAPITELEGLFWIPANNFRVPGRLVLSPRRTKLDLDGVLTGKLRQILSGEIPEGLNVGPDALVYPDEDVVEPDQIVIHGEITAGGIARAITLDATMLDRRSCLLPTLGGTEQRTVSTVLLGGLTSGSEQPFRTARMRFANLDSWARLGLETDLRNLNLTVDSTRASGSLTLIRKAGTDPVGWYPQGQGIEIVWKAHTSAVGMPLAEIRRRIVNPLSAALTIAVGSPCSPTGLAIGIEVDQGDWLYIHDSEIEISTVEIPSSRILLNRDQFGMEALGAWIDQFPKMSPIPSILATAIETQAERAIELQVLDLAIAAEGLHRKLFPNRRGMSKEKARAVREYVIPQIRQAFPEAEESISGALSGLGECTFHQRLVDLTERVGTVVPNLTGRSADLWIKRVKKVRNGFAHLLDDHAELSAQALENYVLKQTLLWLLTVVILLEAGVDPEVLSRRLQSHQKYMHLLAQAERWMRDIYQAPPN